MTFYHKDSKNSVIFDESIKWHSQEPKGKLSMTLPKPINGQYDLALAYSPGVAAPCMEIYQNPEMAYEYTGKGRTVAVITNGTAVLGLGNIGSLASKPVMEGKCALMKRFAGIDAVDILINSENTDFLIDVISSISGTWGGINLEDIKAPECFIITEEVQKRVNIPVFHDDQHGTAIVVLAGLINSLLLTKRNIDDCKIVINGAGAAAIACANLIKKEGFNPNNIIICDSRGVIYKGRIDGMNKWKEEYAVITESRTLEEAIVNADIFLGLSVKGALTKKMVSQMKNEPIIFAMANPDPEISPDDVKEVRDDAIIATGRSDYPNQVNNVLGFPYIFRAALDVRASRINDEMQIAAAHAIAQLAKDDINFSKSYIIPLPFDERLKYTIPIAIAKAADESGVSRKKIENLMLYRDFLKNL
ncbi:NADP-dependent malic enzyme [Lyticum sinuosum]|uniref:NADP-dependent malic enzyme n=1 Tax=Lyticum sinuosum TaxID=1332059 RepID=A0AAE5AHZ5_9RICK|nr:NADP-dependent malic enzyme [Lyticum sinuosum]